MYGQSAPQKTVQNIKTKDSPGTLPINLCAADSPTIQPVDFTVMCEVELFIIACLEENASVSMNRVKAKAFIQDPFNPVLFRDVDVEM